MALINKADSMIEDCINALTDEDINKGAKALHKLALYWKNAGLTMQSFLDMRIYIINMAMNKAVFNEEDLKLAEQALRAKRTSTIN